MQSNRRSQLLFLLVIATAITSGIAWGMLDTRRSNALTSGSDLHTCQTELAGMTSPTITAENRPSDISTDPAINRQLRAAAISAHLSDQLVSIEPGTPARMGDTDYNKTPIYVRLNAVSLLQLVGFLYELTITDHALTTSDIELSPPTAAPPAQNNSAEVWTADLTLSYLQYAQHPPLSR